MLPQLTDTMNVLHDRLAVMALEVQRNTSGQAEANMQGQDKVWQAQSSMDQKIAMLLNKAEEDLRTQVKLIIERNHREALKETLPSSPNIITPEITGAKGGQEEYEGCPLLSHQDIR